MPRQLIMGYSMLKYDSDLNFNIQIDFLIQKNFYKTKAQSYGRNKIQMFTTEWSTSKTVLPKIDIHHLP